MSDAIVAVFGKVEQVRDFKGLGVTRITVEIPVEQFVDAAAMLYGKNVLITLAPPGMGGPYGLRRGDEPEAKPEPQKHGGLAKLSNLAALWCKDATFQRWVRREFRSTWNLQRSTAKSQEELAREVILLTCKITSRAELDSNAEAAAIFNEGFRDPYSDFLRVDQSEALGG